VGIRSTPCGLGAGRDDCLEVTAELRSGQDEGEEVTFTFAAAEGEFDVGDDIRVFKNAPLDVPPDTLTEGIEIEPYSFSDFERRTPILGLVVMFVALVLLTGRWQGLPALIGLCGSLAVIVFFIVRRSSTAARRPRSRSWVRSRSCSSRFRSPTGLGRRPSLPASGRRPA
jgi:hypothetical protein